MGVKSELENLKRQVEAVKKMFAPQARAQATGPTIEEAIDRALLTLGRLSLAYKKKKLKIKTTIEKFDKLAIQIKEGLHKDAPGTIELIKQSIKTTAEAAKVTKAE